MAGRNHLAALFASLPDAVVLLNRRFAPIAVNAAASSLLGLEQTGATSLPALVATGALKIRESDLDRLIDLLADARRQPTATFRGEIVTHPDERSVEISLAPVCDVRGAVTGTMLVARDTTSEREVNRLKDQLIANISHDLQTPLASIRACAEMLIENVDREQPEVRERFLGIILAESRNLSHLISNMLDLSRLEGGQLRPNRELTDLRWAVTDVVAGLDPQSRARQMSIEVLALAEPCPAYADEQMLREILTNLLGNAIKYGRVGGHIAVRLSRRADGAIVSVADDGPGIPAEALPRIFERFFRVKSTTESSVKGAGLGLALVKGLVEAHGGRITVESEVGRGTTFEVLFPEAES